MNLNNAFSYIRGRITSVLNAQSMASVGKRIFVLFLASICIRSIWYYLDLFFEDGKTIITTAEFYGEHHQRPKAQSLALPRFTICFSKVFTYTRLTAQDIRLLYDADGLQYNSTPHNKRLINYAWKMQIEDVIKHVKFQAKLEHPSDVFESVFYLPSLSCWRTKKVYRVFAYQAGRVNTLDLVMNAAVYDDVMVNYDSPLVYMFIVPFGKIKSQNSVTVGDLGNAIAISPGTYSTVGFRVTKINSKFRNRNDARLCEDNGETQDVCRSNHNKKIILQKCGIDALNVSSSSSRFYTCGMRPKQTDSMSCNIEPCLRETYIFTKSEGYIKFDKRMSVLNMSLDDLTNISTNLAKAMQLDSQHNPWRRNSFLNLASGIDEVTDSISSILQRPTGFRCDAMKNISDILIKPEKDDIPNVVLEQSVLEIHNFQFINRCKRIHQYIVKSIIKFGLAQPCFQYLMPNEMLYGPKNSPLYRKYGQMYQKLYFNGNTLCFSYSGDDFQREVRNFGSMMNTMITSFTSLKKLSVEMGNMYRKLRFTKFIDTFSAFNSGNDYTELLSEVGKKLQMVRVNIFEGSRSRSGFFSIDNEEYNLKYSFFTQCTVGLQCASRARTPTSFRHIEGDRKWVASQNSSLYSKRLFSLSPFIDVFISRSPVVEKIPALVDLFCRFYHGYLATAERTYNSEPSYLLSNINSRYTMSPDYTLFVIGSILTTYDTANLFQTGTDGLSDAERSSCFNLMGHMSHATDQGDVVFASREQRLLEKYDWSDKVLIKPNSRAQRLLIFLADYSRSLTSFEEAAHGFTEYYDQRINAAFRPLLNHLMMLRRVIVYHRKLVTRNTRHKIFLIGRLKTFSKLVRDACAGSGEHQISEFLSKKGTILIGELRIELAEVQLEYYTDRTVYEYSNNIVQIIIKKSGRNNTILDSIFAALMSSIIHPDQIEQREIIRVLKWCNDQKWKQSKAKYDVAVHIFSIWLHNVTAMVQRAKRYTNSLIISRAFMRNNMMKVSLYYDSLQVFTKTSQRTVSIDQLYAKIANVAAVYLNISLLHILEFFTIVICLAAGVAKKMIRFIRNYRAKKIKVSPISNSLNIPHSDTMLE